MEFKFNVSEEITRDEVPCEICLDVFVNQETLQAHYKYHEHLSFLEAQNDKNSNSGNCVKPVEKKLYYCHHHNTCTKMFTQNELLIHCKVHEIEIHNPTVYLKRALLKEVRTKSKIEQSCEICFELFSTKKALNLHYEIHESVYKCADCNAGFKRIREYVVHRRTHRADNMYQCPSCDRKSSTMKGLLRHIYFHESYKRYKCKECDKRFSHYGPYNEHVKIDHEGEPSLSCDICGENFKSSHKLANHKYRKHPLIKSSKTNSSRKIMQRYKLPHSCRMRYVCHLCGKMIKETSFDGHMKRHRDGRPYKCSLCDKKFYSNQQKRDHEYTHTGSKPYKCPHCNKDFAQERYMVIHSRTHTGERPFKCAFCDEKFISTSHKKSHESKHTGDKPYKCPQCNKSFGHKSTFVIHSRIHTGERPYKCAFCDERFISNFHKKNHESKHTGDKPYKCTQCNKGFARRSTFVAHSRIHTGERPYKCAFCDERFISNFHKKNHESSKHTGVKPYKCPQCNKGFTRRTTFVVHSRIHTGERPFKCAFCDERFISNFQKKSHESSKHTAGNTPYKCPQCNKVFAHKSNFVLHFRTHTGERPFKCAFCDKKFITNYLKKNHESKHTGDKPYKCTQCNKGFAQKSCMVGHSCTHTEERAQKYRFRDEKSISNFRKKSHERKHTGDKNSFKCSSS